MNTSHIFREREREQLSKLLMRNLFISTNLFQTYCLHQEILYLLHITKNNPKNKATVNLKNLMQIQTQIFYPKPLRSKCSRIGYLNARSVCAVRKRYTIQIIHRV